MNRRCLITGASQRFGLAAVEHLMQAGWEVVALTRRASRELVDTGAHVIEHADHSAERIIRAGEQVAKLWDSFHSLVHNASLWRLDVDAPQQQAEDFDLAYAVHMRTPALLNGILAPRLAKAYGSGGLHPSITHITDARAARSDARHAQYTATKAGLNSLTLSLARRFAPRIRVNAIAPGPLEPPDGKEATRRALGRIPLGEMPGFTPLLRTLDHLIGCSYTTGAILTLDGGRTL